MNDMMFIVPSRGRPKQIYKLYNSWFFSQANSDLFIVVDDDDPTRDMYSVVVQKIADCRVSMAVWPRLRLCGSLNRAALQFTDGYKILGFMGDDHRPRTIGWTERFSEVLNKTGLVYGNDLLQGVMLPTAVAMTSNIVKTLGYFAPPCLTHLFLDNVWLDWGREINRITYLEDVIIEHMHPANGKASPDATYAECNSMDMNQKDALMYLDYKKQNLALDVAKLKSILP